MVKQALEGLVGVRGAEVSFPTKQAVVIYDTSRVTVTQMVAAIQHIGFAARHHQ